MSEAAMVDVRMDASVATPRAVRVLFADRFAGLPGLDDLLLCVSEVVTNAVLHACAPIRVVARSAAGVTRVEVLDGSPVSPVRRRPDPSSPTGRGLALVDRLCTAWGVDVRVDGKTVWFEYAGSAP